MKINRRRGWVILSWRALVSRVVALARVSVVRAPPVGHARGALPCLRVKLTAGKSSHNLAIIKHLLKGERAT